MDKATDVEQLPRLARELVGNLKSRVASIYGQDGGIGARMLQPLPMAVQRINSQKSRTGEIA